LYALLPSFDGDAWSAAAELLTQSKPDLDAAAIDTMVALAQTVVEQAQRSPIDEVQGALDAYVLAVALLLRDRADDASEGLDRRCGMEELLSAAQAVPASHPAALAVLRSLGAFLDGREPLGDEVLCAVAGRFADRIDRAMTAGISEPADLVTMDALRCLCRAAEALADLRFAAGKVPAEYPWRASIIAAV
jgi:hypothetical protein